MDNLIKREITDEQWREYEFGPNDNRTTYRIKDPRTLFYREGGSTHRVVDKDNVVHCPPAPGFQGCVLRWQTLDPAKPVQF